MSLIINKTASDGSLFQGWGRNDLSGEENTATNRNKGFLSIRNSNAVPNQIERAEQHGRQTISRVAKKERRIDSKVKLYKDRGDRIADRIKEIKQPADDRRRSPMNSLKDTALESNPYLKINFDGGNLSSDAGLTSKNVFENQPAPWIITAGGKETD